MSKPNILPIGAVLLLVGVMSAQQNQTNPIADSQKAASAELQLKVVHRERPVYPQEAKAKGISGTVGCTAVVDKQGDVISAKVIEGDKVFWDAAITAVKAFKFVPPTSHGQPVETATQIKINFCSNPGC